MSDMVTRKQRDELLAALTRIELDHVLTLMRDASRVGGYYGNRAQYWRRHERIWRKLERALVQAKERREA